MTARRISLVLNRTFLKALLLLTVLFNHLQAQALDPADVSDLGHSNVYQLGEISLFFLDADRLPQPLVNDTLSLGQTLQIRVPAIRTDVPFSFAFRSLAVEMRLGDNVGISCQNFADNGPDPLGGSTVVFNMPFPTEVPPGYYFVGPGTYVINAYASTSKCYPRTYGELLSNISSKTFNLVGSGVDLSVGSIAIAPSTVGPDGKPSVMPSEMPVDIIVPVRGNNILAGDVRATEVNLQFGQKTPVTKTIALSALQDGTFHDVHFSINVLPTDVGPQNIKATVNGVNAVNENNYANNISNLSINVQTKYKLAITSGGVALTQGANITIEPSNYSAVGCALKKSIINSTSQLLVKCIDEATQQPVAGCYYTLDLALGENDGGHDHGPDSSRPLGNSVPAELENFLLPISTAGSSFKYQAPEVSQEVVVTVSGTDPSGASIPPVSLTMVVQVVGSDEWVGLSNDYIDVIINGADTNPSHKLGLFGTPDMAETLQKVGNFYAKNLSPLVNITPIPSQAGSLPWGGIYDLDSDWQTPHCGHRDGNTIDLSVTRIKNYERAMLNLALIKNGIRYVDEATHWHATLKSK